MLKTPIPHKGYILVAAIVTIAVGRATLIVTPISHDGFVEMKGTREEGVRLRMR
jgi:hypothetical protein